MVVAAWVTLVFTALLLLALDPTTAVTERPPLGMVLGVCGGLLLAGSLVAGVEAFRLLKIMAVTDNKTNLLVTIANRLNDAEDYLRILHYNLTAEYHPPLPAETEAALRERGVLPAAEPDADSAPATDGISASDVAPAAPRRTPDTAFVEQHDDVPATPPIGERPPAAGNDDAAAN